MFFSFQKIQILVCYFRGAFILRTYAGVIVYVSNSVSLMLGDPGVFFRESFSQIAPFLGLTVRQTVTSNLITYLTTTFKWSWRKGNNTLFWWCWEHLDHFSTFWYFFLSTMLILQLYYLNSGFKNDQIWLVGYL